MILSGLEIAERIGNDIEIDPYNSDQLNPNSYNLRLHDELMIYEDSILDMRKENKVSKLTIPESGYELIPGKLYLGRTVERTRTDNLVPMLEGRSSIGRLGMFVHVTAGFGDVGFNGFWTLEIFVVQPLIIYPNVEICQIYYHHLDGEHTVYKSGKYQNNNGIQPSKLHEDFK
ncbi:dCTP deaminase [Ekhidna sp.]